MWHPMRLNVHIAHGNRLPVSDLFTRHVRADHARADTCNSDLSAHACREHYCENVFLNRQGLS